MAKYHPIPKQNVGPPRATEDILKDITDPKLKREASHYFRCFRFMNRGYPCTYCFTNQVNVLHLLDNRETECFCSVCCDLPKMIQCCEDYLDEESISDDALDSPRYS